MNKKESKRDLYGGVEVWNKLLGYVKKEILEFQYSDAIPKYVILRLDGLSKGNFINSKYIKPMAKYQYEDILTSFEVAKVLMKGKTFTDIGHKFNYAMKIVESKINDVVKARLRNEKVKEKIEIIDLSIHQSQKAEYRPKSMNLNSDVLDKLW